MFCIATRQESFPMEDSAWGEFPWKGIPSELLRNHMGKKPEHFPKVEVKIAYDDMAGCIMFRVEDRYVRATARAHQDNVYKDSCVEFFFTPGSNVSKGYFNLEILTGRSFKIHFMIPVFTEMTVLENSVNNVLNFAGVSGYLRPQSCPAAPYTLGYQEKITFATRP